MDRLKIFAAAFVAALVLSVATAPTSYAGGFYVSGSTTARAYWDPACACWVYPSYTYRPTYYYPTYPTYAYPRYYYPSYYSRPTLSLGLSIGRGGIHFGSYGHRRWYR